MGSRKVTKAMILIYPDKLLPASKIGAIFDHLKIPTTYDPNEKYDMVLNNTVASKHIFSLKTDKYVINRHCNNVLKDYVDKRWEKIYGYGIRLSPMLWTGYCIKKPLEQGTNSGEIIKCPTIAEEGYIYTKIVDTRISYDTIQDLRVFIMKGDIILTIIKKKSVVNIFENEYRYEFVDKKDVFSDEEIEKILKFSEDYLDFGEIDILRSNFDGKIYVVDVNNIPGYGYFVNTDILDYAAKQFKEHFL